METQLLKYINSLLSFLPCQMRTVLQVLGIRKTHQKFIHILSNVSQICFCRSMAMHMKTLKQNANQINQNFYSMWLGLTLLEKVFSSLLNFLLFVGRFHR